MFPNRHFILDRAFRSGIKNGMHLKRPSSPFCAYFLLITKFVIVEVTVRILFKCSQCELLICKFHLLNEIKIPMCGPSIINFVMSRKYAQNGLFNLI